MGRSMRLWIGKSQGSGRQTRPGNKSRIGKKELANSYGNYEGLVKLLIHQRVPESKKGWHQEGFFEFRIASYVSVIPKLLAPFMLTHSGRRFAHAGAFANRDSKDHGKEK